MVGLLNRFLFSYSISFRFSSAISKEKMFDLLNERQFVPVPGASCRASSNRPENDTVTYDANGKWQPPSKWLGKKLLPGSSGTAKEVHGVFQQSLWNLMELVQES